MSGSVTKFGPAFKALIKEAGRKTFGDAPVVPHRTGRRIFKQIPRGPIAANYYPPDMAKNFRRFMPGFTTESEEIKINSKARLQRRGKGPPKKGEGKRAMKNKGKK
jgi:hypothetical protein